MDILETQLVQRAHDGYWERIVRVLDLDNQYSYKGQDGIHLTSVPSKWLTVAVYPFIMEEAQ